MLLSVAATLPLWWVDVPPLTDFPGHLGRYAIQLDGGQSADLSRFYAFEWQWIGNLGVDLLVQIFGPLLGVEYAAKLSVLTIPAMTVAGFLFVAREVHGRVPPTALFALPLAWNYAFLWGFVNFSLSMALCFLAFALWLRVSRMEKIRARGWIFAGLSLLLWTAHVYGWAMLCILAGSAELVRQSASGKTFRRTLLASFWKCVPLLTPLTLMLWRFGDGGAGGQPFAHGWFNFALKEHWFLGVLRDRWEVFDKASLALLLILLAGALIHWAWRRPKVTGMPLVVAAVLLWALYALMPHNLIGSAYADMRLAPFALAVSLLAIGPVSRGAHGVALVGLAFFGARVAATSISMDRYDARYQAELAALAHIPVGARLVSFVGRPCVPEWAVHRLDHLPSMALVRRRAFANDQWQAEDAQLIRVTYQAAGRFVSDPSQFVVEPRCERHERMSITRAMATFPRAAFDYIWIIDQPDGPVDLNGLDLVWQQGRSRVYRVIRTG